MPRIHPMKIADLFPLTLLLAGGCIEEGEASPSDDDEAIVDELAELDDEAPELVEADQFAAVAPPAGTSVWSEILLDDGSTRQFMLHTTVEGEVVFEEMGGPLAHTPDLAAAPPEETAALNACADDAYILQGWRWESRLKWYFHAGSTPSELTADAAEAAIKAGTANITASHNSCDLADEVGASHEYLGRKSKGANISTGGNCLSSDGYNVVSFGDLPQGVLATACVWFSNGVAKEGDIQLNKQDFSWTTSPGADSCKNRWSLRGVMTHERGHTFGLGHVGEGTHGNLTMSPNLNGPCQDSESTLGDGDVQGLRAMY